MRARSTRPTGAREQQLAYNAEHGIDPQTVRKRVGDIIAAVRAEEQGEEYRPDEAPSAIGAAPSTSPSCRRRSCAR
jgi:excinuclease UvrABC helicase subunit UvrB